MAMVHRPNAGTSRAGTTLDLMLATAIRPSLPHTRDAKIKRAASNLNEKRTKSRWPVYSPMLSTCQMLFL